MENKKSFIMYTDSLDILNEMTDEQAGQLFKAIKSFQHGIDTSLDLVVKMAFIPIKNQFIRDNGKWEETKGKRALAGSKGGRQKVANATKIKQINPVNVNDTVTVSDTVNENGIVTVNDKQLLHPLQIFIKDLSNVSSIKTQLTYENCLVLIKTHSEELVKEVLLAMENTKGIANRYTSVYLTLSNWINRRKSTIRIADPGATDRKRTYKPITPDQL